MDNGFSSLKRRTLLAGIGCAGFMSSFWVGRKFIEYAFSPVNEKDYDTRFDNLATDNAVVPIQLPAEFPLKFRQLGGFINDASHIDRTPIYGIVEVSSEQDVKNALGFARKLNLKVTACGQRHTMGGQAFVYDGLVLDMRQLNSITLDKENLTVQVQSGAKWADIQEFLDPYGLSVKAMQSINIFTVGGTISANAHGVSHDPGPIAATIKSLRIMLSDGEIQTASRSENTELFSLVIGGYGVFGIILEATIEIIKNEIYKLNNKAIDYRKFTDFYEKNIDGKTDVGLFYARMSISPFSFLTEIITHTYYRGNYTENIPPLNLKNTDMRQRFILNLSKNGKVGKWIRWILETNVMPLFQECLPHSSALTPKEECLVSRNQEMYDSMGYLHNRLKDTDILQEYFIPCRSMAKFVDELRAIVQNEEANLLNVTIRVVQKDDITYLPYAKETMFAFVLYFNLEITAKEYEKIKRVTSRLIEAALHLEGTFYLPYQLFYSVQELRQAYPNIDNFFKAKGKYDPILLFNNEFYRKYAKAMG